MLASIIIRTFNEQQFLGQLLDAIGHQDSDGLVHEVIIVDSGSTDETLKIAEAHSCRILHIVKEEFSFGRSLNVGCEGADGNFLIFVSGHCVPADEHWLKRLVAPVREGIVAYAYGRQIGNEVSRFSERQVFSQHFPALSSIPQEGFFCNNANAAIARATWEKHRFDEELTGLEDMELGKRLVKDGLKLGYISDAMVYHHHAESWHKIKLRYEREAIALQHIMPEVHISFGDFLRYFLSAVFIDSGVALQKKQILRKFPEIAMFRLMQYWGTYVGNHEHRKLSKRRKELLFYPR